MIKLTAFILLFFSQLCFAKYDGKIIEIKRALSLTKTKAHHKEFYIDAGSNKGLKKNHIISVFRKKTLIDPLANRTAGDLWLPVGEIKIIHVDSKVSVGRIYKVPTREALPELDYETFMVGDRLNIGHLNFKSTMKSKRKYSSRKGKYGRGIASVHKNKKVFNGNYSFPDPVREELNKRTNGNGNDLKLNGTSATGIKSAYKIKAK